MVQSSNQCGVQFLSFAKKGLADKGQQQGYGPMTDRPFSEKQQIQEPVLDLDQQFQKSKNWSKNLLALNRRFFEDTCRFFDIFQKP
jgi:hypothetical protein